LLEVDADHQEPQTQRSFTDEGGQLDSGDQAGGDVRGQDVGDAVTEICQAVDHQQDADGSGKAELSTR
jgi:hypothetical protein